MSVTVPTFGMDIDNAYPEVQPSYTHMGAPPVYSPRPQQMSVSHGDVHNRSTENTSVHVPTNTERPWGTQRPHAVVISDQPTHRNPQDPVFTSKLYRTSHGMSTHEPVTANDQIILLSPDQEEDLDKRVRWYTRLACFVLLCCNLPCGALAYGYAYQASMVTDRKEIRDYIQSSLCYSIVGIVMTVVVTVTIATLSVTTCIFGC